MINLPREPRRRVLIDRNPDYLWEKSLEATGSTIFPSWDFLDLGVREIRSSGILRNLSKSLRGNPRNRTWFGNQSRRDQL